MTVKYFVLLTNLGAAKLANAAALGTQLQITQMAVGDGGGALPTPNPAQTQLIAEKRRAALNSLSIDEANSSQIIAEQVIPETDGGWWIREVGLFDKDGILIAIANCPDTYKPQLQEGSGRTQTVRMVLIVSSTEAITLKIDPSVVLATRQYVDKKVDDKAIEVKQYADKLLADHEKSRNHPDASLTAKGFAKYSSATTSDSEVLAATPKAVKTAVETAAKDLGDHGKAANPHDQYLQIANLLSEVVALGPESVARLLANLGLSDAANLKIGTTAGTVAAGDDSRIVNAIQSTNTAISLPGSLTTAGTVTGGGISSVGSVYAGNTAAWLAADGNVYGSVWGGYLSTYLSNRTEHRVRAWAAVQGNGTIISSFGFSAINRTNVGGYNFTMSTSNGAYAVTVGINGGSQNGALNAHSANIWNRTPNSFSIQNANDSGTQYNWIDWPEFYVIVVGP
ncbi:TPA: phage tail protein [Yersinia enterocolitica]|uniref:Tail fiber protein n=1 Tax=Yersinia phage vB_YenM_42.18 TaxID=2918926 RepID=A0AAE9FUR5_9CAUD|nr:phage tail protein [Yersinia enterocolitica]YP_010664198.1 tail fiber protein [Yersinia phage vB_YenM_42.18]MCE3109993.1 phage tail protein [Yersinia enterocolitica]MCF3931713.1 phage tail protein [Yersinia enterocolitica]UNA05758.1 tail fiber protein [Yersinia phage vB_YenM_42.18]CCV28397.1 putative phage-related protein [Yersinia enterocolitica (type O:9) str. YE212/02]CCV36876.1 putative phage-related protein [Yersinia enterocolitica (type O:9) str. YE56/03]